MSRTEWLNEREPEGQIDLSARLLIDLTDQSQVFTVWATVSPLNYTDNKGKRNLFLFQMQLINRILSLLLSLSPLSFSISLSFSPPLSPSPLLGFDRFRFFPVFRFPVFWRKFFPVPVRWFNYGIFWMFTLLNFNVYVLCLLFNVYLFCLLFNVYFFVYFSMFTFLFTFQCLPF